MKRSRLIILLVLLVAVLLVVALVAKKKGLVGGPEAVKVSVEEVSRKDIVEIVSASGKIQSEKEVVISPDVAGEIMELTVKEGDKVQIGQLLVKINPDIQQSNVERLGAGLNTSRANYANARSRKAQAEARLINAKASFDRSKQLFEDKVIAQSEYDAAVSEHEVAKSEVDAAHQSVEASRYNVKSAEAALKEANKNLTRTEIFSPVEGTVSKLNYEKGERVVGTSQMQGSEIMNIADLDEMEVVVDVNENDIIRVGLHDTCDIEVDAYLGEKFKGIVTNIANSAMSEGAATDQVTNFEVKVRILRASYAELANTKQPEQSPFRPGMSATVDIRTRKVSDALAVPIEAVTTRSKKDLQKKETPGEKGKDLGKKKRKHRTAEPGGDSATGTPPEVDDAVEVVFVEENGTISVHKVKTGIQDNEDIEIISGLEDGNTVVVAPYREISKRLGAGDKVEVVPLDELYDHSSKAPDK